MAEAVEDRYAARQLDQRGERTDICPSCGGERQELHLPPHALFYCPVCEASTIGPNDTPPAPDPEPGLFSVSDLGQPAAGLFDDEPPIDEGMAWVADEMPDE